MSENPIVPVTFKPIGIIHSPFVDLEGMPIQPIGEASAPGVVEIYPEFVEGLKDLDGFSHIYLIYYLHKIRQPKLLVTPFLDDEPHGILATRSPSRPNAIGLSLVKLTHIEGNQIHVARLDILDQTPLLDIKPYVPEFEELGEVRTGWLTKAKGKARQQKSDARFK